MTLLTLIRKDLRVYRAAIVGTVVLMLAVYALGVVFWMNARLSGGRHILLADAPFAPWLWMSTYINHVVIVLLAAVYGGMSFALERRERWAEFLCLLQPHRLEIVASKLLVVGAFLAGAWFLNQFLALFARALKPDMHTEEMGRMTIMAPIMLFGVAWLFSTFLTSPAISACISIAVTTLVILSIGSLFAGDDENLAYRIMTHTAWTSGLLAWVVGTIYYARRVAP